MKWSVQLITMQTTIVECHRSVTPDEDATTDQFHQLCRFCAKNNSCMMPIFRGQGLTDDLPSKIKAYVPVEVSEDDTLPLQICSPCVQCLTMWHEFITGCLKADENLRVTYQEILKAKAGRDGSKSVSEERDNQQITEARTPVQQQDKMSLSTVEMANENEADATPETGSNERSRELKIPTVDESAVIKGEGKDNAAAQLTVGESSMVSDTNGILIYSIYVATEGGEDEYYLCDVTGEKGDIHITENATLARKCDGINALDKVLIENGTVATENDTAMSDHNYIKSDYVVQQSTSEENREREVVSQPLFIFKCVKSQLGKSGRKCHSKLVQVRKIISCPHCGKQFRNEAVFLTHMRIHTGVTPFYCRYCGKSFRLSLSLRKHMDSCKNMGKGPFSHPLTLTNNRFVCTLCRKSYKLKSSLKQHMRSHFGTLKAKLKCEICEMKFCRKAELLEHKRQHPESPPNICEICGKLFLHEKDLSEHHISHSEDRPFECSLCGTCYKRKSHLSRHLSKGCSRKPNKRRTHVKKLGKEFICGVCFKVCKSQKLLLLHNISHTGEKRWQCSQCEKRFAQSGALHRHIRTIHGGVRDFICKVCHRSFTAKATLLNHSRIHTGEKPFLCQYCPKTFRTQQQHRLHQVVHTDARPHSCTYCSKTFRRRPHLVVHIRTHTGEKPYPCPECGKAFAQKNDMTKHFNTHKKFQCNTYCPDSHSFEVRGTNVISDTFKKRSNIENENKIALEGNVCLRRPVEKDNVKSYIMQKSCHGRIENNTDIISETNNDYECQTRNDAVQNTGSTVAATDFNKINTSNSECPEMEMDIHQTITEDSRDKEMLNLCNSEHNKIVESKKQRKCDKGETAPLNLQSDAEEDILNQNGAATKQNLIIGLIERHDVKKKDKKSFRCSDCEKVFFQKDSFLRHLRIHTDERPFTCHICGKGFRDSGGLTRHLRDVHARVKNFKCDICGTLFAAKATCDDHRRTHTGERPFICAICGKRFSSKASHYMHAKTHTDIFPYNCNFCERRFRRRQELLVHKMTHTGERPCVCDICGREFRVSGELQRHKFVHSKDKPYCCSVCGMSFRQKRYLVNHFKKQHKDQS
ncbi:zinc finger protein 585A-like [Schistocerca americana]|uniref:zinc finger protein 585A-like n=1 Tax=Schistocerca americana TaxID=7009 RepID=UPI001F4F2A7D|nr:zinc finger protein 585A-like [Schistocerca americana]